MLLLFLDTSNTNNGNNNPSSSQGSSDSTYTPPATTNNNSGNNNQATAPTCSGGKMGLAWDWQLSNDWIPHATTGKTCWLYNWSPSPPSAAQLGGLKFVPMYWGPGSDHAESFSSNVLYSDTNYGLALAMNEVNEPTQSNLDAGTGAALWRQYLLPLRQNKGYYIISPSTTSAPTGIQWMQDWLGQLGDNEKPDALALHWYGTSFNDFQGYVTSFHTAFPSYKLWITEFACTDFSGQNIWCDVPSFAAQAAAWIEQQDYIGAAFPFGFVTSMVGVQEENRLIGGDSWLTGVGNEYLS